jgi:hypothetical protein
MSLIKKSDVKNHLSLRYRTQIHLSQPESQPDATGFSVVEMGKVQSDRSTFAEDFVAEHSSSGKSIAAANRVIGSPGPKITASSKSAQA